MSQLTRSLEEVDNNFISGKSKPNGISLTIYLPDYSSIELFVQETCTFGELVRVVLQEHKIQNLEPALNYCDPNMYEVRIHEGLL